MDQDILHKPMNELTLDELKELQTEWRKEGVVGFLQANLELQIRFKEKEASHRFKRFSDE